MSLAAHGLISQPVFRLSAATFELVGAVLFLIPRTARLGAAFIACYMVGPLLSHVFVLGYGAAFVDAVITFVLPVVYLVMTHTWSANHFGTVTRRDRFLTFRACECASAYR